MQLLHKKEFFKIPSKISIHKNIDKLAYLAGIIDGEGSIQIFKRTNLVKGSINPTYNTFIKVENTNPKMIQFLHQCFSGNKYVVPKRANRNHRQTFCWNAPTRIAVKCLAECYDFLIIKQKQASTVFQFRKTYEKSYGSRSVPKYITKIRDKYYSKLKQLHHTHKTYV
jgi:hypothetical protein